jgi:phage shock protein A
MEYLAVSFAGLSLLLVIGTTLFGGGRGLSSQFAALDKSLTAAISLLRSEVTEQQQRSQSTVGNAMSSMRQQMHDLEKAMLTHRAEAAETYMRRDSYYKASDELKREVNTGFDKMEKRLERMEGKIDYDRKEDHGRGTG